MQAFDPTSRVRYVRAEERDTENASVFVLRPLTARERFALRMTANREAMKHADGAGMLSQLSFDPALIEELLRKSLVGWENVRDASGAEIVFNEGDMDANLDKLTEDAYIEVGYECVRINFIGERTEGKSPPPSQ